MPGLLYGDSVDSPDACDSNATKHKPKKIAIDMYFKMTLTIDDNHVYTAVK